MKIKWFKMQFRRKIGACVFPFCTSQTDSESSRSTWQLGMLMSVGKERNARSVLPELISETTATAGAAKPVNNTSMTIWKAQAFGALCWAFGLNLKQNQYLTWPCQSSQWQLSQPAVSKAYRGVTHEWRKGGAKSPRLQESSSLTQWWTDTHLYRHVPALQKRCILGVQQADCVRTVKDTALRWPRLSCPLL